MATSSGLSLAALSRLALSFAVGHTWQTHSLGSELLQLTHNSTSASSLASAGKAEPACGDCPPGYIHSEYDAATQKTTGITSIQACAEMCEAAGNCSVFEWSEEQKSCGISSSHYYRTVNKDECGVDPGINGVFPWSWEVTRQESGDPGFYNCARPVLGCEHQCPPSPRVARAIDDPHLENLAGENFEVNVPGDHSLLRIPEDTDKPALVLIDGTITPSSGPCSMYITMVTLAGEWFADSVVRVRPHTRDKAGANNAGKSTLWEFGIRVSKPDDVLGEWTPFPRDKPGDLDDKVFEVADNNVSRVRAFATRSKKLHRLLESQAFRFEVGHGKQNATITISQASHQGLNIIMEGLGSLGEPRLGGLLGTAKHDKAVEERSFKCLETKAMAEPGVSRLVAIENERLQNNNAKASW